MKLKQIALELARDNQDILSELINHFQYSINDIKSYDELTEIEKTIISKNVFDEITDSDKCDIGDHIDSVSIPTKYDVEGWIRGNYLCTGLEISDKLNEDGLYEAIADYAIVNNKHITSLTNGMFVWSKAVFFDCSYCTSLKSIKGAPKKVEQDFYCSHCSSLTSLEGSPEVVGGHFSCYECDSLKTLDGSPKRVRGLFSCSNCNSLISLDGSPQEIGSSFSCNKCKSLESLKGAPKKIGGNFDCRDCKVRFTIDEVKSVSDVKEKIII